MIIVLDLDDTLYLEQDYVLSGFRAVDAWLAETHQLTGFCDFAWPRFLSGNQTGLYEAFLSEQHSALLADCIQCYRTHTPTLSLLPDAKCFIELASQQHTLCLITDGRSHAQHAKIDALSLRPVFDTIVVTGDWGPDYYKPHPRAFETVQGNHKPADCIYIADNPKKDFVAPTQLGWQPSIRIKRKGGLHEDIDTPAGMREVNSLDTLAETGCFI